MRRRKSALAPPTLDEALHELHVHEAELELQVEELRASELRLQTLSERLRSLYDDAPVGYVTLDRYNHITQANHAASMITAWPRGALRGQPFSALVAPTSRGLFYLVARDVRVTGQRRAIDVELSPPPSRNRGNPAWAHLDAAWDAMLEEMRVTLIDVTRQRSAETRLRELTHRLITVQEEERSSAAAALHDDAGQQLTYLGMLLDRAHTSAEPLDPARMEELAGITRSILQRIRSLSSSLSPAALTRVGLPLALQTMISEFSSRTGLPVAFEAAAGQGQVPSTVELASYRIIQEALTNAARHASANAVSVSVRMGVGKLAVWVQDNGMGFDTDSPPGPTLGLLAMQERARGAGGKLLIESAPGKGTRITFQYPVRDGDKGRTREG